MMPFVMAIAGIAFFSITMSTHIPAEQDLQVQVQSEARINQFRYMHKSAAIWHAASPRADGKIDAANITANLPTGGTYNDDVVSLISGGVVYTYTQTPPNRKDVLLLGKHSLCSEMVGVTRAGNSYQPACLATGPGVGVIPTVIPQDVLIIMGPA
ncbi:MAG: hypothetical protein PSN44_07455 [Gammaproteobacteria bacterium]|nr:hypothetical protein [Gammaproteobacteria bacterium]